MNSTNILYIIYYILYGILHYIHKLYSNARIMVKSFAIDARFVRTQTCLFELVILQ